MHIQCTLRGYCAIQKFKVNKRYRKAESFDFVCRRKRKQRKMPKGKAKRRREKLIPGEYHRFETRCVSGGCVNNNKTPLSMGALSIQHSSRITGLYYLSCRIRHKILWLQILFPYTHTHTHNPVSTHTPHTPTLSPTHLHTFSPCTESVSPDEDSESVCSSLDGSVCSEDGGLGLGVGGEEEVEEGIQFQLSERIDQLGDKK